MAGKKEDIITFKVDNELAALMRRIPNRSQFIRAALLAALDNACPLCGGTGFLTTDQKDHWSAFTRDHHVTECNECHQVHIICEQSGKGKGI